MTPARHLAELHAAAERHATRLAETAKTLRTRELRDIENATASHGSVGEGAWKPRWRAELAARAAADVRDALAELREV